MIKKRKNEECDTFLRTRIHLFLFFIFYLFSIRTLFTFDFRIFENNGKKIVPVTRFSRNFIENEQISRPQISFCFVFFIIILGHCIFVHLLGSGATAIARPFSRKTFLRGNSSFVTHSHGVVDIYI